MRRVLRAVLWMNMGLVALEVSAWVSSGPLSLVNERAVDAARIRTIAEDRPDVRAAYGIRSRDRPGEIFAELTIALDPELDVLRSHRIADEVEARVGAALVAREVVVHVEPAG